MFMDDPNTEEVEPSFNDLPIITLAEDEVVFDVGVTDQHESPADASDPPAWQRWNDYGIGLLRRGQLRQAETAFQRVEDMGHAAGPLNLARVYLAEGRVTEEAPAALRRAREVGNGAPPWSLLWFSGLVNKQIGEIDAAIDNFEQILAGGFAAAQGRGFNFANDYRLLIELADTRFVRGLRERGPRRQEERRETMVQARDNYLSALKLDPENAAAHYGISRVYEELGEDQRAKYHAQMHAKFKLNDNARDTAIAAARQRYPAANRAAEKVVIYDLQRAGAYELRPDGKSLTSDETMTAVDRRRRP
jgi:tetratricopeptide (TPR) repeat protein